MIRQSALVFFNLFLLLWLQMIQLFRGCKAEDMPPHIYASAQSAYRNMSASRCDQSLVFVGRSASGKTHNFRNALHYLCIAAGCPSKILTGTKKSSRIRMNHFALNPSVHLFQQWKS